MPARPPRMSRRRLLQVTGGALVAASAGAGVWAWLSPDEPRHAGPAGARRSATAAADQVFLHVIAHPDDALFFMNPDLEQSIRSGARSVTVCLTGGESDGHNAGPGTPDPGRVPWDRAAFARARMNGMRAAHAVMATGDPDGPWDVAPLSLLPGFQVELQTLRAAPWHQLIFLELVEARTVEQPRATSLRGLWLGVADTLPTLRPTGTPVPRQYRYTRDQVTETLRAVLDRVRPTVVRTLDPNAVHSPKKPPHTPDPRLAGLRYYDHQDHTASAYFTQAALAGYWGRGRRRPAVVENYLGYENGALPNNLDIETARRKADLLSVYGWADHRRCGDPAGCGDRKVGGTSFAGRARNWTRSTRLRAPGSNGWLRPAPDGRLTAFAIRNGAAYSWTETEAAGVFGPPVPIGGELLQGQLHAVCHPDGFQLLASRTVLPGHDGAHRRELLSAMQSGTERDGVPAFERWESLGSPDPAPVRSLEIGFPAGVATTDGTAHVFVRTWDGGVACRSRPRGAQWSGWQRLEGPVSALHTSPQIIDGLDVCVDSDGLVHLVAPGAKSVQHWVSKEAGQIPRPAAATGLPEAAGPVSIVPMSDGAVRIAYRRPDTAQVLIAERQRLIGGWQVTAQCDPVGGYGRVAMAPVGLDDQMVIAARDDAGEVRVAMAEDEPEPWQRGRVPHSGAAGVAQDAAGRAVVVALGNDGKLYAARQTAAGLTEPFEGWRVQAGSLERTGGDGAV
ncbi:PIG-L family deacetylase [Streptomyces celluloflavus]|uniref:PIG-L family deacetylase n=1 Tax=Streptomyces celluloflavus TaxID=58344 RepID=UPI003460131E|nr:PIG-L family deacetylase [Streptomyces celluloflavus]